MKFEITRRDFMKSAAVFSALGVAPQFLTRTIEGAVRSIEGFKDDRVLVVIQLGGGNDGLNTLVPYGDDAYYKARPNLALQKERLIPVNDYLAFNDRLQDMMRLYDNGNLAVVQGVGYPNPDRSHFRSMEIWHTASDSDEFLGTGWIGRYFDHHCSGSARPQVGAALGNQRPQAFENERGFGVAFEDPGRFGWQPGQGADNERNFADINSPAEVEGKGTLDFLRHVTSNAIMSSEEVREAADRGNAKGGRTGGRQITGALKHVAALIRGNLATRIFYVSTSGFDTHAGQAGQHDYLLSQIDKGLAEFQAQLQSDGTADRVLTMVFSEFGRRVRENQSGGTDHGTAAPMFLMGDNINPGIYGRYPNLTDLENGDLKHNVDFRQVYATVLNDWFHIDAKTVLGRDFKNLPIIA